MAGRLAGVSGACLMIFTLAAPEAQAQQVRRKFKDKIHVVQKKPVLQKKRLEIAPRFGLSFNDPLYRSFKVGANLNYHIAGDERYKEHGGWQLLDRVKWLQANPERARDIAYEGSRYMRQIYRTEEVLCYMARLLDGFSQLLDFAPRPDASFTAHADYECPC